MEDFTKFHEGAEVVDDEACDEIEPSEVEKFAVDGDEKCGETSENKKGWQISCGRGQYGSERYRLCHDRSGGHVKPESAKFCDDSTD